MLDRKYTKYVFLIIAILNAYFQLSETPIRYKNWISAIIFIALSIVFLIKENKKGI